MPTERKSIGPGPPKPSSQAKRDLSSPEGQRTRIKIQTREKGKGYLSLWYKGVTVGRKETGVTHRKMAVYNGARRNPVFG